MAKPSTPRELDIYEQGKLDGSPEICICAAVQFHRGPIIRGHRHDSCFHTAQSAHVESSRPHVQGFLTSRNRFVTREEGARLQNEAGIVSAHTGKPIVDMLFSEDLYLGAVDPALESANG